MLGWATRARGTRTSSLTTVTGGPIGSCLWKGWASWVNSDDPERRFTLSLPLLPSSSAGDFAGVARGHYDVYFRRCAARLKDGGGTADTIIRLGWEANGNTFP